MSTQNTNVNDFPNLKMSVLGPSSGWARSPGVAQRPTIDDPQAPLIADGRVMHRVWWQQ
jgi:hypothetical protein